LIFRLFTAFTEAIFLIIPAQNRSMFNVYANQLSTVLNRYTSDNPNGDLARYNQYSQNNLKISDVLLKMVSYLRIQNVSLGYNMPRNG